MTECAARLVDEVLPRVPVRQWVLSLPYRLRYLLAWDHALARAVLGVSVRVLLGFQRHRARRHGIRDGRSGSVTVIQRFGGGLNLNIHFHTLLFDGVFFEGTEGALEFRPLPPPTDEEVGVVLARIAARVLVVDGELQRRLDLKIRVLPPRRLEIDDDEPLGVALEEIPRPDEIPLEHLARVRIDERDREWLLDGHDLPRRLVLLAQHGEHAPAEVEQPLPRLTLAVADRLMFGLELPERLEEPLHLVDAWTCSLADAAEEHGRRGVNPGPERAGRRHEVGGQAVHVREPVAQRAAQVLIELREADMRLLTEIDRHHGDSS
jgi:hypothetical protein